MSANALRQELDAHFGLLRLRCAALVETGGDSRRVVDEAARLRATLAAQRRSERRQTPLAQICAAVGLDDIGLELLLLALAPELDPALGRALAALGGRGSRATVELAARLLPEVGAAVLAERLDVLGSMRRFGLVELEPDGDEVPWPWRVLKCPERVTRRLRGLAAAPCDGLDEAMALVAVNEPSPPWPTELHSCVATALRELRPLVVPVAEEEEARVCEALAVVAAAVGQQLVVVDVPAWVDSPRTDRLARGWLGDTAAFSLCSVVVGSERMARPRRFARVRTAILDALGPVVLLARNAEAVAAQLQEPTRAFEVLRLS